VPYLQKNEKWPTDKFWADTDPACPNANRLYQRSQYCQSVLRQYIDVFLLFFALDPKLRLSPNLHQRLQYLASTQHTRIRDNTELLAQEAEKARLKAEKKERLEAQKRAKNIAEFIAELKEFLKGKK